MLLPTIYKTFYKCYTPKHLCHITKKAAVHTSFRIVYMGSQCSPLW